MNRERPTVILVMAILNFVFGGLFIVCGLCGILGTLLTGAMFKGMAGASKGASGGGPDPFGEMSKMFDQIPGYYPVQIGTMLLMIVLNIVLIVAGVGLLKMQPWARWTSVGYGAATILLQMMILAYAIFVVQPAMEQWTKDFTAKLGGPGQPPPNMAANSAMSTMGSCFNFVMYTAYPLALMIVMVLPNVGAAFSAPPLPDEPPGGGYGGLPPSGGVPPGSPHVTPRRF